MKQQKQADTPNIRFIRFQLKMTQREFSQQFDIPLGTLRRWEQNPERGRMTNFASEQKKQAYTLDIQSIRIRFGMTQEEFSKKFDIPLGTLRRWEQIPEHNEKLSRILRIAKEHPEIFLGAITKDST